MTEGPEKPGNKDKTEQTPMEYLETYLKVPRIIHDAVCNFIIENYSAGLVIEDEDQVEDVGIKFYVPISGESNFSVRNELAGYIRDISENLPTKSFSAGEIRVKVVQHADWEKKYRNSIKPIFVKNVIIRPPWLEAETSGKIDLIIEPKMAFGTGSHETTRLCIIEMLEHFKPGMNFLDLGCGSGILAILAAKLGAGRVHGVDIDLTAVENARENAKINGVSDRVEIFQGSVELAKKNSPYDFLTANIIKNTIVELFEKIYKAVRPGGRIILSGLLKEDEESVGEMLSHYDIKYDIKYNGQWLVINIVR